MPFSNLPKTVILSGADCFHLVLDKHAEKHGSGGNVMRQAFYFAGQPDPARVLHTLQRSPLLYWLCNIKLSLRPFFQTPCWTFTDHGRQVELKQHQAATEKEIPVIITDRDITLHAERFIEFDLVHYPSGNSVLVLSWNHILLDGKGTSMLIKHLDDLWYGMETDPKHFFPAPEKKVGLLKHIRNMYQVKAFVQQSSKAPIASIWRKGSQSKGHFGFRSVHFTAEECKKAEANAFKNGARFGANLFYIAGCAHAVHEVNLQRSNAGDMWIPIPYDGRLRGAHGPMISNCVASLFYRLNDGSFAAVNKTVGSMSNQMASQMKEGMPKKYALLQRMMRHIPLGLYYLLISRAGGGGFASFLYSTTGDNFNQQHQLFGQTLSDITLLPAATFPPGLTFIFLKHNNALNINITWSPDVIKPAEMDTIEQVLRKILLAD